ncbi:MAG: amino acid ABC transporter permease [Rhodobacteraceae bacterium]|nr:amino acid ABC transporter permease [Paracoccaceae bacterium]
MIAPQAPPVGQGGAIKWLRENLFSGPLNTILTILSLVVLWLLLDLSFPWLAHSMWSPSSLGECRTVLAEAFGPDAYGACWGVIRVWWQAFVFGTFPTDSYWRPVLAFALLFVALAPVLYSDDTRARVGLVAITSVLTLLALYGLDGDWLHLATVFGVMAALTALARLRPRGLLLVTLFYPILGYFLLWGGGIWGPLAVLVGFGLMAAIFARVQPVLGVVVGAAVAFLVAAIWWAFAIDPVTGWLDAHVPLGLMSVNSDRFGGFLLSFVIGVSSISASLPLGVLLALGRRSDMFLIKTLSVWFIEFVRGVPLITMLFTASLLLQYFLPPQTKFDLILRVVILVTFFAAAYIAEVIRGGLAALPRGQYEAADALGLDFWQAQRLIIMPQALKISIPGIVSTFIGLFKDTTLVAFVGLNDPLVGITRIVRADINWKGIYWEPYLFVGVIFFIACFGMSRYSMYLERKLKTDHR